MARMKTVPALMLICGAMLLAGCEDDDNSLGDAVWDLLFGKYMSISATNPPPGEIGAPYYWEVHAEVKNEPFDNLYDYHFSISEGRLPTGLVFYADERVAWVEGTPQEAGEFPISIHVFSHELMWEEDEEDDDVLWYWDTAEFVIPIAQ
jgi:hypothetical protein